MLRQGAKFFHEQQCPFCYGQKLYFVDREYLGLGTKNQAVKALLLCDTCESYFSEMFRFERRESCDRLLNDLQNYCLDAEKLNLKLKNIKTDIVEFLLNS